MLGGLARGLYNRLSDAPVLRRPLAAVRNHPRVRAYARRHVDVLLQRGATWANVDGALRLLAEDKRTRIVFGPWPGDTATELLYWVPFVRWAQRHFALDPERLVAVSRGGVAHWYEPACRGYVELEADSVPPDASVFPAGPVHALVEEYRSGSAAPRPLLKRAVHEALAAPDDPAAADLPQRYLAVAATLPELPPRAVILEEACSGVPAARLRREQHAVVSRADGLLTDDWGLAVLGALSGVPVIALRSSGHGALEPDLDLALRLASELSVSLTLLGAEGLNRLFTALGSTETRGTVDAIR
jgi:hypothetical protein